MCACKYVQNYILLYIYTVVIFRADFTLLYVIYALDCYTVSVTITCEREPSWGLAGSFGDMSVA